MPRVKKIGIAYAACALFFNVGMDVFAKLAAVEASTWQIVLFRWFFGLLILSIPFIRLGSVADKSPFKIIHGIRVVMNLVASFCLYHALGSLPLSIVLTVFFLEPVIAIFAAVLLLDEPVSKVRWGAGFLGLLGVAVIARPEIGTEAGRLAFLNFDVLIAMLGATCWAVMRVLTKKYSAGISVIALSFWLSVSTTIAAAPMAWLTWHPIALEVYLLLFAVAGFGAVYNYMWLNALMQMPVARLANLSYIALPFSFLVGFLVFGEISASNVYFGTAIILCVMVVTANKALEQRLQRLLSR